MEESHQNVYAANLRQNFGYPLRNPKPNSRLGQPYISEGLQIGDVGYVDDYGEFIWLFNIKFPLPGNEKLPEEFHDRRLDPPDKLVEFAQPAAEQGLEPERVFMTGVKRLIPERPRATYEFTATSKAGAILILPDGATLSKLDDKQKLEELRQHASKHALRWCGYARRNSLYLVTATYRTKTWTLGSFYDGSLNGEIFVHQQSRDDTAAYSWSYQFNVDHQQSPRNNYDVNQTVLIRGFKITVRWQWSSMTERAEKSKRWFSRILTTLWPIGKSWKWLSQTKVVPFPTRRNLSQPLHPLDVISYVLLDKGWSYADLMQKDCLREFIDNEYTCDLDSEYNVVHLRSKLERINSRREPAYKPEDLSLPSLSDSARFTITNMRLENIDIDQICAGVCILIQFGETTKRTDNKPHASVIEWDDVIVLPPGFPINVTACGAFQLGSALGIREICTKQTINTKDLSADSHLIRLPVGKAESCSSLLITLVRHFSHFSAQSSHNENSVFAEKTNMGFKALYAHHDELKKDYLEDALECFQCALEQHGLDRTCRATALFNLATAKFIKFQANGTFSELKTLTGLYSEALELRNAGDLDRPATLLLLVQGLLLRYGREHDESTFKQIEGLLSEIHHDGSRNRQTADTIMRTCRFYQAIHTGNSIEVDKLLTDLDRCAYAPPYGFFDWSHMLHKLGVALWTRFQLSMNLGDLDKSIALNEEALHLLPDGHHDEMNIVTCLGPSLLRLLEVRGDLMDLDMTASFAQLREKVITEFDNMESSIRGVEASWQKLHTQMRLMSTADTALHSIVRLGIGPSYHTPEVQDLIDEWRKADGTPTKCKRQLGLLLSFLQGEGETKMRELLVEVKWPFKEHKIEETVQILQSYMPFFHSIIASTLKSADEFDYTPKQLHQRRDTMRNCLFKEEIYTISHGPMEKFVN